MPVFGPIKRKDLIYYLKELGFTGPYSGGKHQYMLKDELRLTIPNPHKSDIGKALLAKILEQGEIDLTDWQNL